MKTSESSDLTIRDPQGSRLSLSLRCCTCVWTSMRLPWGDSQGACKNPSLPPPLTIPSTVNISASWWNAPFRPLLQIQPSQPRSASSQLRANDGMRGWDSFSHNRGGSGPRGFGLKMAESLPKADGELYTYYPLPGLFHPCSARNHIENLEFI
jgi:hypothetical protein